MDKPFPYSASCLLCPNPAIKKSNGVYLSEPKENQVPKLYISYISKLESIKYLV